MYYKRTIAAYSLQSDLKLSLEQGNASLRFLLNTVLHKRTHTVQCCEAILSMGWLHTVQLWVRFFALAST